MRKIITYIMAVAAAASLACGCRQDDIVNGVDFRVSLDPGNTYVAGTPVTFRFDGDADYIVYFSGEEGHEYRYHDRTSFPVDEVESLSLDLRFMASWGTEGGLDIYVSDTFSGLDGHDGEKDRATLRAMEEGGMQGWTKLPYAEGPSEVWTSQSYDLTPYRDNFSIAFHWHPWTNGFSRSQRTYNLVGGFTHKIPGMNDVYTALGALPFVSVLMNEQEKDPYMHDHRGDSTSIATVRFEDSRYDLHFYGCNQYFLDYELDAWVISSPHTFNNVQADRGVPIKNMTAQLRSYSYVFEKPGTYQVTFLGTNSNFQGEARQLRSFTINIVDPPLFQ